MQIRILSEDPDDGIFEPPLFTVPEWFVQNFLLFIPKDGKISVMITKDARFASRSKTHNFPGPRGPRNTLALPLSARISISEVAGWRPELLLKFLEFRPARNRFFGITFYTVD
jgi:hypothetical protein